jgi:hypothetical protein
MGTHASRFAPAPGCTIRRLVGIAAALLVCSAYSTSASAQAATPQPLRNESSVIVAAKFIGGGVLGLAMHESGHLVFDVAFAASPNTKKVSYAGIPFFAITHRPVSPVREFVISSAGFWVQHATNELLLTKRPDLRHERAPFVKGLVAFNVLTSIVYTGAALARTGPDERDTRGMAVSSGIAEPWIGGVILGPALLDAARYVKPRSPVLRWASRAAKIGGVVLFLKARHNAS